MDNRKKLLFYLISIFIVLSCSKKDDVFENIEAKPAGKYLSEITHNDWDKTEFEYNDKRYLKRIIEYGGGKIFLYMNFFYNSNGQIVQIDNCDLNNKLFYQEMFIYENQKLVFNEFYDIEKGEKILNHKFKVTEDSIGNITIYNIDYHSADNKIISGTSTKYYFNSKRNVYKIHYEEGATSERIVEYEFDNMINPFYNLNIPFTALISPSIDNYNFISPNNPINSKTTFIDNSNWHGPDVSILYDTLSYNYENNHPIAKEQYGWRFFKYIDLK